MSHPTLASDADHVELSPMLLEFNWRLDNHRASSIHKLVTDDVEFQIDDEPVIGR